MKKIMKKSFVIAFFAVAIFAFSSCAAKVITISEHEPVALISVIGNTALPWQNSSISSNDDDDDGNGLLSNMVNKLIDGKNPELLTGLDRVDYAEASFRQLVSDVGGAEVLDKDDVVKSDAYIDLGQSYYNLLSATVSASDYKDLTTIGGKKARMLMDKINAKSLVLLHFDFQKKLNKGNRWNGDVSGVVNMKVKVLNERGKEVLNKTITTYTEPLQIRGRKYSKDELVALFPEAIDNAIREFVVTYFLGE